MIINRQGIELIKTALQSLQTNKKRSFLTIIGIMIGIAAVITILGIGDGITKTMYDKYGNNNKQGQQSLKFSTLLIMKIQQSTASLQQILLTLMNNLAGKLRKSASNMRVITSIFAPILVIKAKTSVCHF